MKTTHRAVISRETTIESDEKREFGEAKSPENAPTTHERSPLVSFEMITKFEQITT